jgi:hypothetical protein
MGNESPLSSYGDIGGPRRTSGAACELTLFRPTRENLHDALLRGWFLGWWDVDRIVRAYELFRDVTRKCGLLDTGATTFTENELQRDWSGLGYRLFFRRDENDQAVVAAVFETCLAYPMRCALVGWAMQILMPTVEVDRPMARHYRDRANFISFTAATFALKRLSEDPTSLPEVDLSTVFHRLAGQFSDSSNRKSP